MLGVGPLAGCRACGSGYDYSSPVADCTYGNVRAGSIISGGVAVVSRDAAYEEVQPEEASTPQQPADGEDATPPTTE
jgi:hypothetical protein